MTTTKKVILIGLAICTGVGIGLFQKPQFRDYIDRKVTPLLPKSIQERQLAKAYKWQDQKGRWQLTDTPPPAGVKYDIIEVNPNRNTLPSSAFTGKKPN